MSLLLALVATFAFPAAASTGGTASATAVGLKAGPVTVLGIPLLTVTDSALIQAVTPGSDATGNGFDSSQLLGLDVADILTTGIVTSETLRTPAGLRATSSISDVNVDLLGINGLVTADAVASSADCPIDGAGPTTADTMVTDLRIAGVTAAIGSVDVGVAANLNILGIAGASVRVSVTQEEATTADTATATALRVQATLRLSVLPPLPPLADIPVLDLRLAASSCDRPDAIDPSALTIDPDRGPIATVVTITGTGFVPGFTTIDFGGITVPADAVTVTPDGTSLTVLVPVGSTIGPKDVVVITPGGSSGPLGFTVTDGSTGPTTTVPTTAPVTTAPVTTAPVTTAPVTTAPVTTAPVTTAPVTTAPVTTAPVTTAPVTTAPATTAPVTTAPATTAPVTTAPATTAPVTTAPVTTAPATTAPVTTAPATTAPVTTAPVTTAPVTTAPVTIATTAPVTTAPATTAPASTAPATTAPDATAPVTTAPVTAPPGGPDTSTPVTTAPADPDPADEPPTANDMMPTRGPVGTPVVITGGPFVPKGTTVNFGPLTIEAADVMVTPDGKSLAFRVPADANLGPTPVSVVTDAGESGPLTFTVTGEVAGVPGLTAEAPQGRSGELPRTGTAGAGLAFLGFGLILFGSAIQFRTRRLQ